MYMLQVSSRLRPADASATKMRTAVATASRLYPVCMANESRKCTAAAARASVSPGMISARNGKTIPMVASSARPPTTSSSMVP